MQNSINLIAAISKNYAIGRNGSIPWHLNNDLRLFRRVTTNQSIIMGRKTFESLPGVLKNRNNIVVSSQLERNAAKNLVICKGLQEALKMAETLEKEIFIIGGQKIFETSINFADKLYITHINTIIEDADTFFPKIDLSTWQVVYKEEFKKDANNDYDHTFRVYKRIISK